MNQCIEWPLKLLGFSRSIDRRQFYLHGTVADPLIKTPRPVIAVLTDKEARYLRDSLTEYLSVKS